MKIKHAIILLVFSYFIVSCGATKSVSKNTVDNQQFPKARIDSIKSYLSMLSGEPARDTIIIKYEFNNEHCWDLLDEQSNEYITRVIESTNNYISKYKTAHPGTSVYHIRENGRNQNALVLKNNQNLVDNGYLRKSIFIKKALCGTSLKLYPDGTYKFIYSDSHFTALAKQ
jgi:hypothetical protein